MTTRVIVKHNLDKASSNPVVHSKDKTASTALKVVSATRVRANNTPSKAVHHRRMP